MSSGRTSAWSLAWRLTAGFAASAFLLIFVATAALYWSLSAHLNEEQDEILRDKARILTALVNERPFNDHSLRREIEWEWEIVRRSRVAMRVLDADGRVLVESPGFASLLPPSVFPAPNTPGAVHTASNGSPYRLACVGTTTPEGQSRVLQLALDRSEDNGMLREFRSGLWIVLAAAPLASALVGFWVARRGLKPVDDMCRATARINASTLAERMPTANLPAELAELGETFNAMLNRLEDAFARVTRFSADIAHELRTPVQILRGEAEFALAKERSSDEYREALVSSLDACDRLARLIDTLLFLARADNPERQIARDRVHLTAELEATRAYYEPLAQEAGVALTVDAPEGLVLSADRTLLQRALGNLVSNAIEHTPSGGRITLSGSRNSHALSISVQDTGRGIPPEHLPYIFDRFYRADSARTTTAGVHAGLGLALVKSIAVLHGGSVDATSEPGKGTRIRIQLPD